MFMDWVESGWDWDRAWSFAGTAVRFEPGQDREVELVEVAGSKSIYGFRGEIMSTIDGST